MKKNVAIIGAGPAGLAAAKSCLESGLSPTIFEKSPVLGGVWSGHENGLAWSGMHTNISKWSCMFSDFPWPQDTQDFPTQSEVADYLAAYADAFNVRPHIRFSSPVSQVSKAGDTWQIGLDDRTENFDALIIASGFFAKAVLPEIKGAHEFEGQIIHSSRCRPSTMNLDKKITVYGGSLSGYELAIEFARVARNPVTHAFKRASWVLDRYVQDENGYAYPLDVMSYSRSSVQGGRQESIDSFKSCFGNPGDTHKALTVSEDPSQPLFVTISDGYLDAVREGKICPVVGSIERFDNRYLVLKNPQGQQQKILSDHVVMATGYVAILPYLDNAIKEKINYDENDQFMPVLLHETVWPEGVDGLAFVGFYRGPFFGVIELQARWAAGVFSGDIVVPSPDDIAKGVQAAKDLRQQVPRPQFPYSNYVALADGLAKRVGCYPDLTPSDPLYDDVYQGFFMPSHFRLSGRHSNRAIAEQVIGEMPYIK